MKTLIFFFGGGTKFRPLSGMKKRSSHLLEKFLCMPLILGYTFNQSANCIGLCTYMHLTVQFTKYKLHNIYIYIFIIAIINISCNVHSPIYLIHRESIQWNFEVYLHSKLITYWSFSKFMWIQEKYCGFSVKITEMRKI